MSSTKEQRSKEADLYEGLRSRRQRTREDAERVLSDWSDRIRQQQVNRGAPGVLQLEAAEVDVRRYVQARCADAIHHSVDHLVPRLAAQ